MTSTKLKLPHSDACASKARRQQLGRMQDLASPRREPHRDARRLKLRNATATSRLTWCTTITSSGTVCLALSSWIRMASLPSLAGPPHPIAASYWQYSHRPRMCEGTCENCGGDHDFDDCSVKVRDNLRRCFYCLLCPCHTFTASSTMISPANRPYNAPYNALVRSNSQCMLLVVRVVTMPYWLRCRTRITKR